MQMSRVESMLNAQAAGEKYDKPRLSRIEEMLGAIIDNPNTGGGSGGGMLEPDDDFDDLDMDEIFSELSKNN